MSSIKEKACIYYLGLITGYISKEDVVKWADDEIGNSHAKSFSKLIDLSLSMSKKEVDVASTLIDIVEGYTMENAQRILYAVWLSDLVCNKVSVENIITYLSRLTSQHFVVLPEEEYKSIMYLSDAYYLATEDIYGNLKDTEKEIVDFLKQYAANIDTTIYRRVI